MLSGIRLTVSSLVLCLASSAGAQENLDKNKTAAQLYASDCAGCHKSPQSLKATGPFGLESFLREHYTTSGQSAAAIAAYVNGLRKPLAEPARDRAAKRTTSQAKSSVPTPSESKEGTPSDILRPPADIKSGR